MRARIIAAAVLVGVTLAVVASTASGGTTAANSITVWLQTDADKDNWKAIIRAANGRLPAPAPGRGRRRPVPDVGEPPAEVRRKPRRRQRTRRHRDGQHRDVEVHGCRGVPGPHLGPELVPQREHLARWARGPGPLGRQDVWRAVLRGVEGRDVPDRSLQEGRRSRCPRASRSTRPLREKLARQQGDQRLLACLHRRARTGTSRWASSTTTAARSRSW